MTRILKSDEFNKETENGVVIVDFFATWCGPCKMLSPIIDQLEDEMSEKAKFFKVDVDNSPELAQQYEVSNIPAVAIIKDGVKQEIMVGFAPKENLKEKIEKYL